MQPIDISDEDLKEFFSRTEMIEVLTLTGGEPSLAAQKMETTLAYAKLFGVKITHGGLLTNGLVVPDRFVDACKAWADYTETFGVGISADVYHKQVPTKNIAKLVASGLSVYNKPYNLLFVLDSGRGSNISYKATLPANGQFKPYWVLNGWIMEPTYLSAKGDLVAIDGSYDEQDHVYNMGHVTTMDYDMFMQERFEWYVPPTDPMGINGAPNWPLPKLIEIGKKGNPGPTYFHEDIFTINEFVRELDLPYYLTENKVVPVTKPKLTLIQGGAGV